MAARKKTTKSKKSAPRKKIEDMEQANGKLENIVSAAQDLDQVLGLRQKNPFGATSIAEFEGNLSSMNLTDMREMAVNAGIFPSGNRTVLKKKLIKGFDSFCKGHQESKPSIPIQNTDRFPNSEMQKKIDEIWSKK